MFEWIKREYIAVIAAIFIGILCIGPYYLVRFAIGPNYKGMPLLVQDSEGEYLGEIRDVTEGHYKIASSVFYEYKDSPVVIPPIGHWIYAAPSMIFGFSVVSVDMAYKFILPVILFLFLYVFLMEINDGSRFWSLIGASVVVVGPDLVTLSFVKKLLFGDLSGYVSLWTRPVNPILGMIGLSLFMYFIYKIFVGNSNRFVFTGILLGLMVGYFFSFVYAGVLCFSLVLVSYFLKKENIITRNLFYSLSVGVFTVGILFSQTIFSYFFNKGSFLFSNPSLQGMFYTHMPLINKTSIFATTLFFIASVLFYLWKKERVWLRDWWVFCLVLLFTNQVVYNIQVLIGWTIWPAHFVQYTNQVVMIVGVVFLSQIFDRNIKVVSRALGFFILFILLLISARIFADYKYHISAMNKFQTYAPVMSWLNDNSGKDCVVNVVQNDADFTMGLNRFISAFTPCDVYNSYHIYQNIPRERVFHNVLVWMWFQGVEQKNLSVFLNDNDFWIRSYLFRDWRDMFCCGGDKWVANLGSIDEWADWDKREKAHVFDGYTVFLRKNIPIEINKYKLDYVIVDKSSVVRKNLQKLPWLKEVFSDDNYIIYLFDVNYGKNT